MAPIELNHFINGEWIPGEGKELVSTSPTRPSDVVASGHYATSEQVEAAITAAHEAKRHWASQPMAARADILTKAADIIRSNAEDWGRELSLEEGKTLPEGIGEVNRAAAIFDFQASEAIREAGVIYHSPRPGERIEVVRTPVGVVSMITPFNFPIAIPAWKAAPALIHGNTIVWKPAHAVPLLAVRITQALEQAGLPKGVINLVIAPSSQAEAMLVDPRIAAVTFTGSTRVGRAIASQCAAHGIPVQAEMGGKNPAIVLADANVPFAATQVLNGAFNSTGQKCTATSRVVVVKDIAEEFTEELLAQLKERRTGDPLESGISMGPMIDATSRDNALAAVDRNAGDQSRVLAGGAIPRIPGCDGGYFLEPTVVRIDSTGNELWQEELFAPVLALLVTDNDDEAFKAAAEGDYGLSAAVFTNSLNATFDSLDHLDVGILHVNSETAGADPHVPFGGAGASGLGPKEQGRAAREFFTHTTTLYLGRQPR
ncbi:aldehyde dehydrogenase family protein [Corynebacterium falsenii]|uniref:Aldehyde dehydrogenase family protein n=1 Tax=Corynebacterium falsenii TaxID=108486 RepID=A0A418Q6Z1_9CORY|nr:aldehyde dehydrogenase family protein [Corynebacterium falsenii]RIX34870.1 aldehyde dehydrogenase family protein [Corynebacterium falsenii]